MSLILWPIRIILKPFRAVGRLVRRIARRLWLLSKLAFAFAVVMVLLDALLNRDGEDDDGPTA